MNPTKKEMIHIINEQPDDSTYDEIFRELALARMIDKGLDDSNNNRVIDNNDMKRKIDSWQK